MLTSSSRISGDRPTNTSTSAAKSPSSAAAPPAVRGSSIGGRRIVARAATASRADLASVRPVIGVTLNSPKHPQPTSGRTLRTSISAHVATTNISPVPSRIRNAGQPCRSRPEVRIRPKPNDSSQAQTTLVARRRSRIGKSTVGPSAASNDRRRATWKSLDAQPPSSIAATSGICTSPSAASISPADRDRGVEAAPLELAAEGHEAGQCQVGDAAADGGLAGPAAVAGVARGAAVVEQPGGGGAAGDGQGPGQAGAVVADQQRAADRQVREGAGRGRLPGPGARRLVLG